MTHDSCHVDLVEKPFEGQMPEGMARSQLLIRGMGCPNCATRVHNALIQLDGVYKVDVLLENGTARVMYDQDAVEPRAFLMAVELVGRQSNHNYQAALAA